nr:hypothetical protein [Sphingomonas sp.]
GYGSGSGSYWRACVKYFAAKWADVQKTRLAALENSGATIAFWRSGKNGKPCNGGKGSGVKPGDLQTVLGPLSMCGPGALHATLIPPKWKGERWWIVALTGEIVGDEEKFGALSREIIGECE